MSFILDECVAAYALAQSGHRITIRQQELADYAVMLIDSGYAYIAGGRFVFFEDYSDDEVDISTHFVDEHGVQHER